MMMPKQQSMSLRVWEVVEVGADVTTAAAVIASSSRTVLEEAVATSDQFLFQLDMVIPGRSSRVRMVTLSQQDEEVEEEEQAAATGMGMGMAKRK